MNEYSKKYLWFLNFHLKLIGGQNHSLNLIRPGQGQRSPVFFYTVYKFENHIYIYFVNIVLKSKNDIQ